MQNEHSELEPDVLHVNASVAPDLKTPLVFWHLNGAEGTLTLLEARERAEALILASAIAETEARIALKISGLKDDKPKGFGKPKKTSEEEKFFYRINMLMRDERTPLPEGIRPIFGWKSKMALVEIDCYGEPIQWEPVRVRHHANALLVCAEASESDRFFYIFLKETLDVPPEEAHKLIREFSSFRNRVRLEDLAGR